MVVFSFNDVMKIPLKCDKMWSKIEEFENLGTKNTHSRYFDVFVCLFEILALADREGFEPSIRY